LTQQESDKFSELVEMQAIKQETAITNAKKQLQRVKAPPPAAPPSTIDTDRRASAAGPSKGWKKMKVVGKLMVLKNPSSTPVEPMTAKVAPELGDDDTV
jgi:hypothetical protein